MLVSFDLQNVVTALSCISQSRDALKYHQDQRLLELLYKLEVLWDPAIYPTSEDEREELGPNHLASVAAALARMHPKRKDGTMLRILRSLAVFAATVCTFQVPAEAPEVVEVFLRAAGGG